MIGRCLPPSRRHRPRGSIPAVVSEPPAGPTWTLYASFAVDPALPIAPQARAELAAQAQAVLDAGPARLRGVYSESGYRADSDMLLWLVGHSADDVQDTLMAFRRTPLGGALRRWRIRSTIGSSSSHSNASSHS